MRDSSIMCVTTKGNKKYYKYENEGIQITINLHAIICDKVKTLKIKPNKKWKYFYHCNKEFHSEYVYTFHSMNIISISLNTYTWFLFSFLSHENKTIVYACWYINLVANTIHNKRVLF